MKQIILTISSGKQNSENKKINRIRKGLQWFKKKACKVANKSYENSVIGYKKMGNEMTMLMGDGYGWQVMKNCLLSKLKYP